MKKLLFAISLLICSVSYGQNQTNSLIYPVINGASTAQQRPVTFNFRVVDSTQTSMSYFPIIFKGLPGTSRSNFSFKLETNRLAGQSGPDDVFSLGSGLDFSDSGRYMRIGMETNFRQPGQSDTARQFEFHFPEIGYTAPSSSTITSSYRPISMLASRTHPAATFLLHLDSWSAAQSGNDSTRFSYGDLNFNLFTYGNNVGGWNFQDGRTGNGLKMVAQANLFRLGEGIAGTDIEIFGRSVILDSIVHIPQYTSQGVLYGDNSTGTTTITQNTNFQWDKTNGGLVLGAGGNAGNNILYLNSTTKGFTPPVMTTTQMNAVTGNTGMQLYNSTVGLPHYYNGAAWLPVGSQSLSSTAIVTAATFQNTNTGTSAGIDVVWGSNSGVTSSTGFHIYKLSSGFTAPYANGVEVYNWDNGPMFFATNNTQFMWAFTNGNVTLGTGHTDNGSMLQVPGNTSITSLSHNHVNVAGTGTYSALGTDFTIEFTGTTATLAYPSVNLVNGRELHIVNYGSGSITIPSTKSGNAATITTLTTGQRAIVEYDLATTTWIVVSLN